MQNYLVPEAVSYNRRNPGCPVSTPQQHQA